MDYRTSDADFRPRSRWNPGTIPDLPCVRAAKTAGPSTVPAQNPSPEPDWRRLFRVVVAALTPFPEARQAVIDAAAAFNPAGPGA